MISADSSPEQKITSGCLNGISLLISVFIVISYLFRKSIHSFPLDIAIILCLSCALNHIIAIVDIFHQTKSIISCLYFLHLMGTCLTALISFTVMISFFKMQLLKSYKKVFVIGYSLITLCIPIINLIM